MRSRNSTDVGVRELQRLENFEAGMEKERTRLRSWDSMRATLRPEVAGDAPGELLVKNGKIRSDLAYSMLREHSVQLVLRRRRQHRRSLARRLLHSLCLHDALAGCIVCRCMH